LSKLISKAVSGIGFRPFGNGLAFVYTNNKTNKRRGKSNKPQKPCLDF